MGKGHDESESKWIQWDLLAGFEDLSVGSAELTIYQTHSMHAVSIIMRISQIYGLSILELIEFIFSIYLLFKFEPEQNWPISQSPWSL